MTDNCTGVTLMMMMGFVLSLDLLKVSFPCRLREFLLTSGLNYTSTEFKDSHHTLKYTFSDLKPVETMPLYFARLLYCC